MTGKSKFQISKLLDERIKAIASAGVDEFEPEFAEISEAFIIGFHTANVSNFLGLTTNIELHNGGHQILGLVFFKSTPTDEDVNNRLLSIREFNNKEIGSFETDQNEHLFLIYSYDIDSKLVTKRIFDSNDGSFLPKQPKLSVLDGDKLYNHSAILQLALPLKLNIFDRERKLFGKPKLEEYFSNIKNSFSCGYEKFEVDIIGTNYPTRDLEHDNNLTETLYDHLEVNKNVKGDYMEKLTEKDKKKLADKLRNKLRDECSPIGIVMRHEDYNYDKCDQTNDCYKLPLTIIMRIHLTDPISKSFQLILYSLRQVSSLLYHSISQLQSVKRENLMPEELKVCHFKPSSLGHFVPAVYAIPLEQESAQSIDYDYLKSLRRELHCAYLSPLDRPQFRYSQRITSVLLKNKDEEVGLLCNVHKDISDKSGINGGIRDIIEGTYTYHHYMQDNFNDDGWGCAYRSLQTIISWFKHQGYIYSPDVESRVSKRDGCELLRKLLSKESRVPTHEEIQKTLVDVGDKKTDFISSNQWIGSQEVCYVLDHLYNLDSNFISVSSGSELASNARDLGQHLRTQSTPVMIGGGVLAHTIIGTDFNEKNGDIRYLILDPHYTGGEDLTSILKKGWCGWKKNKFWDENSFYNLCLPQRPLEI